MISEVKVLSSLKFHLATLKSFFIPVMRFNRAKYCVVYGHYFESRHIHIWLHNYLAHLDSVSIIRVNQF